MSTGVPVTDRGFDSSISRGNLRTNSFYNSADHLHTGGNLRGIPMPMRRSLTVLNSTRDLTMGRGQIIDNVGQQSPRASPSGIENDCMDKGQVIDNTGQRSPCVSLYDIDDECLIGGQIIDNFGQRAPHTTPFGIDNDCMDWIKVRLLIMLFNDLPVLLNMILMTGIWLGVRLLIMLVNDLPVLKVTLGFQRLELRVILKIFLSP